MASAIGPRGTRSAPLARRLWPSLAGLLLLAASCGDRDTGTQSGTTAATSTSPPVTTASPSDPPFPVTVHAENGDVVIEERPERIVSLSPTATEMLFAVGAGEQVVAVDDQSNYPADVPTTELSGFQPNVEAIAGYEPDLVVISNEPGDLERSLAALDITVLLQPAAERLEDTYKEIEQLGSATGHGDEATELVGSMREEISELAASVPELAKPLTYYHELDPTYYTATSDTFIGLVYGLAGLRNIADRARGAGSGYPQLSAEYIVDADPDLIFLADTKCCHQSARTVAKRPGWSGISAVENGAVVALDDDVASRWGPRVVDFLRKVVRDVTALARSKAA